MNDIRIFEHDMFGSIRTAGTPLDPMFCLADLCRILELSNITETRRRLDQKGFSQIEVPTKGGKQMMYFVNEKNLYKVIMRSDKPQAEIFQDWVCGEVLPSIRKTGAYVASNGTETDEELMARAFLAAKATIERRDRRIKELDDKIIELNSTVEVMQPKARYFDMILNNKSTVLITQIAQDYGMSAVKFNRILAKLGIQRKVNEQWILYGQYIGKGYVQSKPVEIVRRNGMTDIKYNTEWTQKGRIFLYGKLKDIGLLPLIEQC